MNKKEILHINNVSFSYQNVSVLDDVNLRIKKRDFLGIIGPNGGGKTTLLKLILGILEPQKGTITVFEQPPKKARSLIGYVPQIISFDYNFPINVLEVVLMGRLSKTKLGKRYTHDDKQIALDVLKKVGMDQYQDQLIGNLSGGQRQRVFIARALATKPELLLLDEPVASIDPIWQTAFYDLLHVLNQKLTIVLATHDVSVVSTYIDQIACVNRTVHYHGSTKDGIHKISEMYHCPVELVAHSVPHRSLHGHKNH